MFTLVRRALLSSIVYPLSGFARRRSDWWAFGHARGTFSGNSKYLFLWLLQSRPDISPCWITSRRDTYDMLRRKGYPVAMRWSWRGIARALHSRVFVTCAGALDVSFPLSNGSLLVNLWHGAALKIIHNNPASNPLIRHAKWLWVPGVKAALLHHMIKPDLMFTTSPEQADIFARLMDLPRSRCAVAGSPRLEVVSDERLREAGLIDRAYGDVRDRMSRFRENYIYMPTWRDSGRPFLADSLPDLPRLSAELGSRDAHLYLKLHPRTSEGVDIDLPNITLWDGPEDIYPVLADFDVLISDYSSVILDVLQFRDNGIIVYVYDLDDYQKDEREFSYPYMESVAGAFSYDFGNLLEVIRAGRAFERVDPASLARVRRRFWQSGDIAPCADIVAQIEARLASGD